MSTWKPHVVMSYAFCITTPPEPASPASPAAEPALPPAPSPFDSDSPKHELVTAHNHGHPAEIQPVPASASTGASTGMKTSGPARKQHDRIRPGPRRANKKCTGEDAELLQPQPPDQLAHRAVQLSTRQSGQHASAEQQASDDGRTRPSVFIFGDRCCSTRSLNVAAS